MKGRSPELRDLLLEIFDESYKRLLSGTIETDIQVDKNSGRHFIDWYVQQKPAAVDAQPPGGARNVLGLDPAFRTGPNGSWSTTPDGLSSMEWYTGSSKNQVEEARKELNAVLNEHKVDIVAIGNGTASEKSSASFGLD